VLYISVMANVAALERGLKILDLLIELESDPVRRSSGVAIQQVAGELGVHKSTASRLMQTLVAKGYAVRTAGSPRGFRLGPAAQVHMRLTMDQRQLSELAHPFLERLVDETGECAHAAVASGAWAFVIDDVETGQALRVVAGKGRRVPLHCTSAGKVLLGYGLAEIPHELPARTPRTITDPEILRLHLGRVIEHGYALDDEENHPGVRCISAPVFNGLGDPIGCIGIDGPSVRMADHTIHSLAEQVMNVARDLSSTLGDNAPVAAAGRPPETTAERKAG
jgi:DNA-binding IclR family transcriptional regulator